MSDVLGLFENNFYVLKKTIRRNMLKNYTRAFNNIRRAAKLK
jgi:hypothetical protein